ncbi:Aldose 1-/Glucose-6-phosphate 1-epimerase [Corchorus olitorius]|uniref:Aldose 1-epimerase n=1 Tax=Corchorus olitorius TaxID=93759 RepID=A0A1R3GAW3_9ROSI|nr:Aldose 1-/Glucose-6-phosphate 1-epimerase [Corchorus olitorius]
MEKVSLLFYTLVVINFLLVAKQVDFVHGSPEVGMYELYTEAMYVTFTNWGASIVSLKIPAGHGGWGNIVLGYDDVKDYMNDPTSFGGVAGRVTNRIGGAKFTLNGTDYKLKANAGENMINGGAKGYANVIWNVAKYKNRGDHPYIHFTYDSYDGEEGFPGGVQVSVKYTLSTEGENDEEFQLRVAMRAKAINKPTPVNLALHTYWNLNGEDSGDILSEKIVIFAYNYTPVDTKLIPTGEIVPVEGTPYDFLNVEHHTIGSRIHKLANGYDINYALDGAPNEMKLVAIVRDDNSGRLMQLHSNQPGVQFSTVKDVKRNGEIIYKAHSGLCLQTQGFPDSVNHPNFPSQIIAPGKDYKHYMIFRFSLLT